jgi:putative addiction module component (TIGR02574 family)
MATTLKEIEQQALALGADERAKLAACLLESLQPSISNVELAWAREIESRVRAFDRGDTEAYAADEVFAEARRLLR